MIKGFGWELFTDLLAGSNVAIFPPVPWHSLRLGAEKTYICGSNCMGAEQYLEHYASDGKMVCVRRRSPAQSSPSIIAPV